MDKAKKYKRKKVVYQHPNSLFEKWLTEWKKEAEEKNSNTKYVYQKVSGMNIFVLFIIPFISGFYSKGVLYIITHTCFVLLGISNWPHRFYFFLSDVNLSELNKLGKNVL